MARSYCVVIDECAAPPHSNPRPVALRKTANADQNLKFSVDGIAEHLPREFTARELDWLHLLASLYAADLSTRSSSMKTA